MARDPLAVLLRLRSLEVTQARGRLADRLAALGQAESQEQAAHEQLRREAEAAGADLAAWLPRGLAARDRAAAMRRQLAASAEDARQELTEARVAHNAIENLQAQRRDEQRHALEKRTQAILDDAARRHD